MGRLKDVLSKNVNQKKRVGGGPFGMEMISNSGLVIHQLGTEIHIGKNRLSSTGFVQLPDLIKSILNEYIRDRCNDNALTFSKMFNVTISQEIEHAIREIFIKHKLSN